MKSVRMSVRRTGTAALAATAVTALAAMASGCASQQINVQHETVSTASAAAALAEAQDAACPSTPPTSLISNVSGLRTKLEPLAATKVLLCVYGARAVETVPSTSDSSNADSSPAGDVASATDSSSTAAPTPVTLTNADAIHSLQNALNALATPPTTRVNCPMDVGSAVLGIFTDGQQVTEVLMTTSGCPTATNGQKVGWVGASDFQQILSAALKGA